MLRLMQHSAGAGSMSDNSKFDFSAHGFFIVEDEKFSQHVASKILSGLGAKSISFASNGIEALEQLGDPSKISDILLVDLNMPEMNGVEFLRNLASMEFTNPIILLSGADELTVQVAETLASYRGLNILGRISKPLTTDNLREMLMKAGQ